MYQATSPETGRQPSVLNFYAVGRQIPEGAVYIGRGRGSVWGNPFQISVHGDREEVVRKYANWLDEQPELRGLA